MSTIAITVRNQTVVSVISQRAVSDSINYLALKCQFTADWDGLLKTVIFTRGETAVTLVLDEHDCYTAERGINLPSGDWDIRVIGIDSSGGEVKQRITANGRRFHVDDFGRFDGAPPSEIAPEFGEQIAAIAHDAKVAALAAQESAEGSQESAKASAQSAAKDAASARASESSAALSAENAAKSEQAAAQSEQSSRESELSAKDSAKEAGSHRDTVKADADRASGAAQTAVVSADNAALSAHIASSAEIDAIDAAKRAESSARSAAISQSQMIYPMFELDSDGYLVVRNPETLGATSFSINYDTGNLEVIL